MRDGLTFRVAFHDPDPKRGAEGGEAIRDSMNRVRVQPIRWRASRQPLGPNLCLVGIGGNYEQVLVALDEAGLSGLVVAKIDVPEVRRFGKPLLGGENDPGAINDIELHPGVDVRRFSVGEPGGRQLFLRRLDRGADGKHDIVNFDTCSWGIAAQHYCEKLEFVHLARAELSLDFQI